jgi:hypothetical protein
MKIASLAKYPTTRLGWHKYYAKRHNMNGNGQSLHLSLWYLLLHLGLDPEGTTK